MTWLYNNQPVETLPEDCVGFVYLITNTTNDRKYIGKKLAKFSKTTLHEKYFITVNLNQSAAILKQENNFHAEC